MPTYALQWEGIKRAKEAGCISYDLGGIPPSDNPNHPMHGLYRVKTGFGGAIVHRAGCWDFPVRFVLYRFYSAAERLRGLYYGRIRKKITGAG